MQVSRWERTVRACFICRHPVPAARISPAKYLFKTKQKAPDKQTNKTQTNKLLPWALLLPQVVGKQMSHWWPAGTLGLLHSATWKLTEAWSHWLKNQNHQGNGHRKISTEPPLHKKAQRSSTIGLLFSFMPQIPLVHHPTLQHPPNPKCPAQEHRSDFIPAGPVQVTHRGQDLQVMRRGPLTPVG